MLLDVDNFTLLPQCFDIEEKFKKLPPKSIKSRFYLGEKKGQWLKHGESSFASFEGSGPPGTQSVKIAKFNEERKKFAR